MECTEVKVHTQYKTKRISACVQRKVAALHSSDRDLASRGRLC